jgi:hypothetical protein
MLTKLYEKEFGPIEKLEKAKTGKTTTQLE